VQPLAHLSDHFAVALPHAGRVQGRAVDQRQDDHRERVEAMDDPTGGVDERRQHELETGPGEFGRGGVGSRRVALPVPTDADPEGRAAVVPTVTADRREPQSFGIGAVAFGDQLRQGALVDRRVRKQHRRGFSCLDLRVGTRRSSKGP
jgi:hypothetical protein